MQNVISILGLLTILNVSFISGGCTKDQKQKDTDELQDRAAFELSCRVECDPVKLRTGVAYIAWKEPKNAGNEKQLEFTDTKRGFSLKEYGWFPFPPKTKQLESPVVANSEMKNNPAFNIRLRQFTNAKSIRDDTKAAFEGLEPGAYYYWRVRVKTKDTWIASDTVTCAAPICPADVNDEGKEK